MRSLLAGCGWSLLVGLLLCRVLRQFSAHRTARLEAMPATDAAPRVGIVVPARNEVRNIGACLSSLGAQDYPRERIAILAADDESNDGTASVIEECMAADGRIRLLAPGPLPPGWLGKPHACWRGAEALGEFGADFLCFVDADLRAAPGLLAAAVAAAEAGGIDMLSLQPFQDLGSFWERLIIPAGMLMIACAKQPPGRSRSPAEGAEIAVNGQFILIRAELYSSIGGHRAVRDAICEDNALARQVQLSGHCVRVLAAEHLAQTRMYRDLPSLWEGFAKNAVEIMGTGWRTGLAAVAGILIASASVLVPAWLAAVAWRTPSAARVTGFGLSLAASGIVFGIHAGTLRHFRASMLLAPLFPVAVSATALLAFHSIWLRHAGRIEWKGRSYRTRPCPGACAGT